MNGRARGTIALTMIAIFYARLGCAQDVVREDFFVDSESGLRLFVREVRRGGTHADSGKTPVLLLHGARVPSVASFDLRVPGGSLAAELAGAGHPVYLMDARGYGYSARPPEMSEPHNAHAPRVRSPEVVEDIGTVVEWVRERRSVDHLALLGWATGGLWCGYYATLHPDRVSHLVVFNTLYGGSDEHASIGHGSSLEDPQHPGRFNSAEMGAYRFSTAESLFGAWDRSIPLEDKSQWRDPEVAQAYAEAALASDSTSSSRTPPSFRAPSGALEDSFYVATGHQLWDATYIRSRVLIIASERDFWSRPADRELLAKHLVHAEEVKSVVIPGATHFVHLDRPERGRARFIQEVLSFLATRTMATR
jgi:pimeloyl-ACP methyl ester carboxylesterase